MKWRGNKYIDHCIPFCSVQQLSINGLTSLLIFWLSRCWASYTFPTCSWKIRRHYNIVVLFGNYTGHQVHGDKATSRQDNQLLTKGRLPKKKATKKQIVSFVGTLHDATKVVQSGRGFALRMYPTAARLLKMHFTTRLNKSFWSNLLWCTQTLNGCSILRHPVVSYQMSAFKLMPQEHGAAQQ